MYNKVSQCYFSRSRSIVWGCAVLVSHGFSLLWGDWHNSKSLLAPWFSFFSLSKDQLILSALHFGGMCSSVCAWWEAHYPPQAENKPSILKRQQKRWLVLVSGGPGRASTAGSRRSWLFVCRAIMRRARRKLPQVCHQAGDLAGDTAPLCAHVSPHTGPVFALGRGPQGPPCRGTNNGVAQPPSCAASWPRMPGIIPFLRPNTTANVILILQCWHLSAWWVQRQHSLSRRQAQGPRKSPSRGQKMVFCKTLNSTGAAVCLQVWQNWRKGCLVLTMSSAGVGEQVQA